MLFVCLFFAFFFIWAKIIKRMVTLVAEVLSNQNKRFFQCTCCNEVCVYVTVKEAGRQERERVNWCFTPSQPGETEGGEEREGGGREEPDDGVPYFPSCLTYPAYHRWGL